MFRFLFQSGPARFTDELDYAGVLCFAGISMTVLARVLPSIALRLLASQPQTLDVAALHVANPKASLIELARGGHCASETNTAEFNDAVLGFIARHEGW